LLSAEPGLKATEITGLVRDSDDPVADQLTPGEVFACAGRI
jgi:hypothetical protein